MATRPVASRGWSVVTRLQLTGDFIALPVNIVTGVSAEIARTLRSSKAPDVFHGWDNQPPADEDFITELSSRLRVQPLIEESEAKTLGTSGRFTGDMLEGPPILDLPPDRLPNLDIRSVISAPGRRRPPSVAPIAFYENIPAALRTFCALSFQRDPQLQLATAPVAQYLYDSVPLPVFGSPPQALQTLAAQLGNGGTALAIIASGGFDEMASPPRLIVAIGAQLVWTYFGKPTARTTSEAWERWLRKRLDLPKKHN